MLPSLGQMRVASDTILLLAESLCSASRLYEIARYDTGHQLPSPSRWAATSQDSIAAKRAASGRLQDDCDTRDGSSSSSTTLIGTTVEEVELPRERFAYWCLDLLFLMAARLDTGKEWALSRRSRSPYTVLS